MSLITKKYPVTCHTKNVSQGSIYVAIFGYATDGSQYIEDAISFGATTIVSEQDHLELQRKYANIAFIKVSNARQSLAILSSSALDNPSKKLKVIGVTGTKGKTTTTFLIDHTLSSLGYKTALFGTIKNKIGLREEKASLTTPSADTLQMYFDECVRDGVTHVVMEVSAHALSLDRVYGVEFDIACFTNLASEHMDFYKSMDEYFEAKSKLFKQSKIGLIGSDDLWGQKLAGKYLATPKILNNDISGVTIEIENQSIKVPGLFGDFNSYNILMAYQVVRELGVNPDNIAKALSSCPGVPGRLQPHRLDNGAVAFVDYAHNPLSVEKVLKTLRTFTENLIVVMGCGGNRDKDKRPIMGYYAGLYSDTFIITNDNPRGEDSGQIAAEVCSGVKDRGKIIVELNRAQAIRKAVELSRESSIIALLGKGHEDYYIVQGERLYFDDFKEISQY